MQIMWFLKVFEYRNQVMEGLRMPEILQIVQSATPPIVEQPVLRKRGSAKDISGQQFGRLTALYPTEQRDARGYVIWHCVCSCGREIDITYNALCYGNLRSCGCQREEKCQLLHTHLTQVGGTSMNLLKSTKIPKNNTTGVKGVYYIRGKYVAKIVFQKKQYILGSFEKIQDAAATRKRGEDFLRDEVLGYYEQWQKQAEQDPSWAKENPIRIHVEKVEGDFRVEMLPSLAIKNMK